MTISIDWFRVITQLQRAGFSQKQIAREVGVNSAQTICNWQQGVCEPSHSKGEALLMVYRSVIQST